MNSGKVTNKNVHGCFVHLVRLAKTLIKDEENARDNDVLTDNFAKYSPNLIYFSLRLSYKPFLNLFIGNPTTP